MIVCFGDSLTYGQLLKDRNQAWPMLLKGHILADGVPGDTTRLALERFPKAIQEAKPDAVIIQFGHNDCNRWLTDHGLARVSPRAYVANLEEMIERARKFEVQPFLCSLTPSLRSNRHAEDTERYDALLRGVAKAEVVPLIDVRTEFMKGRYAGYLMPDGLHLSVSGHALYAQVAQQALDEAGLS